MDSESRIARQAGEVAVPVWRLPSPQRAALVRVVEVGGKMQRIGLPGDQVAALLRAGYLTNYDDSAVILTPAALRAIAAEVDRHTAGDADR